MGRRGAARHAACMRPGRRAGGVRGAREGGPAVAHRLSCPAARAKRLFWLKSNAKHEYSIARASEMIPRCRLDAPAAPRVRHWTARFSVFEAGAVPIKSKFLFAPDVSFYPVSPRHSNPAAAGAGRLRRSALQTSASVALRPAARPAACGRGASRRNSFLPQSFGSGDAQARRWARIDPCSSRPSFGRLVHRASYLRPCFFSMLGRRERVGVNRVRPGSLPRAPSPVSPSPERTPTHHGR